MSPRDQFINENWSLLQRISRKFSTGGIDAGDLLQEASVALIDKLDKMDACTWARLAEPKFRNRVLSNLFRDAAAKLRGQNNSQDRSEIQRKSLSDSLGDGELADLAASGDLSPLEEIIRGEENRELQSALDVLTEDELAVVDLTFGLDGEELTQEEIAERLLFSRPRVSQLLQSALGKLRESGLDRNRLQRREAHVMFNPSSKKPGVE